MSDSESSRDDSSVDSNSESNDSQTAKGFNTFANDGSFMEQFKKRMEEAKQNPVQAETSDNSVGPDNNNEAPSSTVSSVKTEKTESEPKKPFYSLVSLSNY